MQEIFLLHVLTVGLLAVMVKPKLELRSHYWGEKRRDHCMWPMELQMANHSRRPFIQIPSSYGSWPPMSGKRDLTPKTLALGV